MVLCGGHGLDRKGEEVHGCVGVMVFCGCLCVSEEFKWGWPGELEGIGEEGEDEGEEERWQTLTHTPTPFHTASCLHAKERHIYDGSRWHCCCRRWWGVCACACLPQHSLNRGCCRGSSMYPLLRCQSS